MQMRVQIVMWITWRFFFYFFHRSAFAFWIQLQCQLKTANLHNTSSINSFFFLYLQTYLHKFHFANLHATLCNFLFASSVLLFLLCRELAKLNVVETTTTTTTSTRIEWWKSQHEMVEVKCLWITMEESLRLFET